MAVSDLPSAGRSHRIWGFQTQRTHHLLSDLELKAFFLFDWNPSVTDFREQYPLSLDDTRVLAVQAGIRHPEVREQIQIMSTDFLVDTNRPERARIAVQVKTSSDLSNPRTVEKLELERRYCAIQGVPGYLLTEQQIPRSVAKNIAWLYPAQVVLDEIEAQQFPANAVIRIDVVDSILRARGFLPLNRRNFSQVGEDCLWSVRVECAEGLCRVCDIQLEVVSGKFSRTALGLANALIRDSQP